MLAHRCPDPDTWVNAGTGPAGFWTGTSPERHFATSSSLGADVLADAVSGLLDVAADGIAAVLEVGCGTGRLLAALAARRPGLELVGVDVRRRPADLDPGVGWRRSRWDVRSRTWVGDPLPEPSGPTLVLAVEWLDELPLAVGREPVHRFRDEAWAALVQTLGRHGGLALMIDYGTDRDPRATLAGYADGRVVAPLARPDRNLTAHVDLAATRAAGEAAGADTVALLRQRDALACWLPRSAPRGPLAELTRRSREAALARTGGLGDHRWLLQRVGR